MAGKAFKIRDISVPRPPAHKTQKIRVRSSQNFIVAMTGTICLLVGLVLGASLVAIPVAATAHAVSSAWDNADFRSMKDQDVPKTERPPREQKSKVVTPLQ